ncbi:MAG: hypothetical protein HZA11_10125 [Nitrospirae bacterium]|nr:hypothetical protein [Nitrospirota bacterium]
MNKEQKFYKKHPIITAIFIALVSAVGGGVVTSSLKNPPPSVTQKEQVNNNIYYNTYTITNNNGPNDSSGLLNINANKNDSFKNINIIQGNQYITSSKVQDRSGTVKFDIPKGERIVVATASDVTVASSVELYTWYENLKRRIANLFKSKQSNASKN